MKIFVIGGLGFIGSNYLNKYVVEDDENEYFCLDILNNVGSLYNIKEIENHKNFKFIECDINNRDLVIEVFKKYRPKIVLNFAAETSVDYSFVNPAIFFRTNVLGLKNLLDASILVKVDRFLEVSTDEVYGDVDLYDFTTKFKETDKLNPKNSYSESKAQGDLLCLSYVKDKNLNVVVTRSTNNYGPHQFCDKLIPLVIYRCLKNQDIEIYGNGQNIRDWIYVEDNCKAIHEVLLKGKKGNIYNIGAGYFYSNISVAQNILKIIKESRSTIKFVVGRKVNDLKYALDYAKLLNEIKDLSFLVFDDGLVKTINWYISNIEFLNESIMKKSLLSR